MKKAKCTSSLPGLRRSGGTFPPSPLVLLGSCHTDEAMSLKNRGEQTNGSEVRFCDHKRRDRTHA